MEIVTTRISPKLYIASEFAAIIVHSFIFLLSGSVPGENGRRGIKTVNAVLSISRSKKYNRERLHDLSNYIKRKDDIK